MVPLTNQINPGAKFLFAHPNKYVFLTQEPIILPTGTYYFTKINFAP